MCNRELTRVVVPETEQACFETARGKMQREPEALVANKTPGDTPDAAGAASARRHLLRFDVEADTLATFSSRCNGSSVWRVAVSATTLSCSRWRATSSVDPQTKAAAAIR